MSKKVYVVALTTESGDDYHWAFQHYPTDDEVHKLFQRDIPEEWEEDCCSSWYVEECKIEDS